MTTAKNPNLKFRALKTADKGHLAEVPCAMCTRLTPVKMRADGWIEIRCKICGYLEGALLETSFEKLMQTIIDHPQTIFRRSTKDEVLASLGENVETQKKEVPPDLKPAETRNPKPMPEPEKTQAPQTEPDTETEKHFTEFMR